MKDIIKKIKEGNYLTRQSDLSFLKEAPLEDLCQGANELREFFRGNYGELCTIINGRSGRCSEDCKFCAQSSYYDTNAQTYDFLEAEIIQKDYLEQAKKGVNRYSIVTAGRALEGQAFEDALNTYKYLHKEKKIPVCASHGLLKEEAFIKLKKAGVTRYHMNLETSREYFPNICTTHTFDEKIEAILNAKKAGLEICSGGIFGMGESFEDRISLALELSELQVNSIPINILTPIKGTPLEGKERLSEGEILRIVAVFRWLNPTAEIRLAAGRILMEQSGRKAFLSGANAAITGDMLTTSGNQIKDDIALFQTLGFQSRRREL